MELMGVSLVNLKEVYLRATAHAADPKDHVCIEYPFSNCQNVGPFDGDAM